MASPPVRLVLFAHGSTDPRWKQTFENIANDLASRLGPDRVRLAYMEFTSPTLLDVVEESLADGITRLRLLPMFMSGGGHVSRDIPRQVRLVQDRFPDLTIDLLPAIGENGRVLDTIKDIAVESAGG
ncbi:MAG: CbiX/SirB N-terminal domain-containing protein [Candidatus Krumholzibacteria bacterium]|nr:CbiX/SirB N-terminal domain-containing protein [Candidatus Krumholzibacteria bacterium]